MEPQKSGEEDLKAEWHLNIDKDGGTGAKRGPAARSALAGKTTEWEKEEQPNVQKQRRIRFPAGEVASPL